MSSQRCERCSFRARYDNNPKSMLGRLWRWHVNWCPGWKAYMKSLPEAERVGIAKRYDMKKFM